MASFRESEQAIHDAAREQVGFDDFGDDLVAEDARESASVQHAGRHLRVKKASRGDNYTE